MGKRRIRNRASELLGDGYAKQQAYDILSSEFPDTKPKRVADVLRYMPTEMDRERFRAWHVALLLLVLLNTLLRSVPKLLDQPVDWAGSYRFVTLVPIATLLVGYSLYRWQGQVFMWGGWANVLAVFALMNALNHLVKDGVPSWALAVEVSSILIGALALYLAYKVFPKYVVELDPAAKGSKRFLFHEDQAQYLR